jgi:hypothetical protein
MWLHKSKPETLESIEKKLREACRTKDEATFDASMSVAVELKEVDPKIRESLLGWGVLSACEFQFACASTYLPWFLDAFPHSAVPVRVEYARYLAQTQQEDQATEFARDYLRDMRDFGLLKSSGMTPMFKLGVSRAFILLTAAYTMMGARSYSQRVLEHALMFDIDEQHQKYYQVEQNRLTQELTEPVNQSLDDKWELFFQKNAKDFMELHDMCVRNEYLLLAKRLELLNGQFQFVKEFKMDESEIYLRTEIVKTKDQGEIAVLR